MLPVFWTRVRLAAIWYVGLILCTVDQVSADLVLQQISLNVEIEIVCQAIVTLTVSHSSFGRLYIIYIKISVFTDFVYYFIT